MDGSNNNLSGVCRECRLCGIPGGQRECVPLFKSAQNSQSYSSKIHSMMNISILEVEGLSDNACGNCVQIIDQMGELKAKVLANQERLKQILEKAQDIQQDNDTSLCTKQERGPTKRRSMRNHIAKAEKIARPDLIEVIQDYQESTEDPPPETTIEISFETAEPTEIDDALLEQLGVLKCVICLKNFKSSRSLRSHGRNVHKTRSKLICCNVNFRVVSELREHIRYHKDNNAHLCKICQKQCLSGVLLKTHLMTAHQLGDTAHQCEVCDRKFTTAASLQGHMVARHGDQSTRTKYPCSQCPKEFYSVQSREDHVKREHEKDFSYICECCGRAYATKAELSQHTKMNHTGKHECDICHKLFVNVEQHKKLCHTDVKEKYTSCEVCGKSIAKNYMSKHMTMHTGRPEIPCPQCGKIFYLNKTLKAHMELHEGKQYPCRVCGAPFGNHGNRNRHEKITHPDDIERIRKEAEAEKQRQKEIKFYGK